MFLFALFGTKNRISFIGLWMAGVLGTDFYSHHCLLSHNNRDRKRVRGRGKRQKPERKLNRSVTFFPKLIQETIMLCNLIILTWCRWQLNLNFWFVFGCLLWEKEEEIVNHDFSLEHLFKHLKYLSLWLTHTKLDSTKLYRSVLLFRRKFHKFVLAICVLNGMFKKKWKTEWLTTE